MADVYTVTFTVIGILLSWPALLVALNLFLPAYSQRMARRVNNSLLKTFVVGLPVTAVLLFTIMITADAGSGLVRGLAFLVGGILLALWVVGSAGLVRLLAGRMSSMTEQSEWARLRGGAVVFVLAMLFPLIGWFLFLPLAGVTAVGAAISSVRFRATVSEQITVA